MSAVQAWMTTQELAERHRTSPEAIRMWRHRGEGPPFTKFGRRCLYRRADVIKWERDRERQQRAAVPA